jgi:nicotinamidase-related amidase
MDLDPNQSAVVAMHCQGDIVGPDGAFAGLFREQVDARGTIGVIAQVLGAARESGVQVIRARVAFAPGYSDLHANNELLGGTQAMGALQEGSPLTDIIPELAARLRQEQGRDSRPPDPDEPPGQPPAADFVEGPAGPLDGRSPQRYYPRL